MTVRRQRPALLAAAGAVGAVGAVALLALGGAAVAVPAVGPTSSQAQARSLESGTPGYCPTKAGVTVVVDFQELGGGIVVRCAPGPVVQGFTGLDALQGAGFSPQGTQRWGLQFICRIADKPAPDQKLDINGDPNYQEACIDTPPDTAFWSYWYAPNDGTWTLSTAGPSNRDAISGGFEGWSFSLNHTQQTAPAPGIAPTRPPHTPPTTPPPTKPPPSKPPHTLPPPTHPTHGSGGGSGGGGSGGGGSTTTPTPTTPSSTTSTGSAHRGGSGSGGQPTSGAGAVTSALPPSANPVSVGHNAAGEKVSGTLPPGSTPSTGSARTTVVGILVVSVLAAGGFVAWRRRAGSG